jgi:hypothetical protein
MCGCTSCPKYATTGDEAGEAVGVTESIDVPMSDAVVPRGMMDTVRTAAADRRHDAVCTLSDERGRFRLLNDDCGVNDSILRGKS